MKLSVPISLLFLTAGVFAPLPAPAADALETALASCWSCHGDNAPPKDPTIPIIQGQQAGYLDKQLRDFRAGTRDSQIMSSMAESIRRDDIARASAMMAAMPWPKLKDAAGSPEPEAIASCKACHGDRLAGGPGPEGIAPRLAGQFAEYLDDQMNAFARGERASARTMTAMMKALTAEERGKIAAFLAGM